MVILDGQVNLSNIQTVSKARLGNYITKLSKEDMNNIDKEETKERIILALKEEENV